MMFRSPFERKSHQTTPFKKKGNWKAGYHTGVDRVSDTTDLTLVSIGNGTVISVNGCGAGYGNSILIRYGEYVVLYGHMVSRPKWAAGQKIQKGDKIGTMGNTGNSYGAHLHIEIEKAQTWAYAQNLVDPNMLIDWTDFTVKEGAFMAKKWTNGGTTERVYQTTKDCQRQTAGAAIGSLNAHEVATCVAVTDECYLVEYSVSGGKKAGYVKYSGGVK